MAALFFGPEEIALNLELSDVESFCTLISSKSGPAFQAYIRGRLTCELELRLAIKQSALNGSSPSQSMLIDFYKKSL